MTEEITTYEPTVGFTAVNFNSSPTDKIYDYFQSMIGMSKSFLFMGDGDYLEFVTVKEAGNPFTRYGRQLTLLFAQVYYGNDRPELSSKTIRPATPQETIGEADDFFCQKRAQSQVIWEGKSVKVLYPDNPIVERHFLIATNKHRDSFKDITKEEFREVIEVAKRIGALFEGEKYYLCKTGFDAGQTVSHFHFHIMAPENKVEGIWGRFRIAFNIIFNMIPFIHTRLRGEALLEKVSHYKRELKWTSS